jgi:hypothetical protein
MRKALNSTPSTTKQNKPEAKKEHVSIPQERKNFSEEVEGCDADHWIMTLPVWYVSSKEFSNSKDLLGLLFVYDWKELILLAFSYPHSRPM